MRIIAHTQTCGRIEGSACRRAHFRLFSRRLDAVQYRGALSWRVTGLGESGGISMGWDTGSYGSVISSVF